MPENLPEVLTEVISHNLKTQKIWFEAGGEDVSNPPYRPSLRADEWLITLCCQTEEEFMKSLMGEHSAALG
jgi:hypothetical protein